MSTWPNLPADHPYGPHNLPYGAFSLPGQEPRIGVRLGDCVLDLSPLAQGQDFAGALAAPTLNELLSLGHEAWGQVRSWIQALLADEGQAETVAAHLHPLDGVTMHLAVTVADYVDFYASEQHASNVGAIFRPDGDALTPNWKHLPIGYHGRSSTIVVSGTDIVRPIGQRKPPTETSPLFGPSVRLDIEAELGFVVGGATKVGSRVSVDEASNHLFGVFLFNDWSARDIQAWEYVPLGPFLGKSFASSVSAWVTPMAALDEAKVALPGQDPKPMDYLQGSADNMYGLDLSMEIELNGEVISRPPYKAMYWSPTQMVAHMTVNGAALSNGDVFASGTCSGDVREQRGSLLELSWSGKEPLTLADGSQRSFLEDGDTVTLRASAPGPNGTTIALGECTGTILPAV